MGASIWLSLKTLNVREVENPPLGEDFNKMVNQIINSEDFGDSDQSLSFYRDHIAMWKTTNEDVETANVTKASDLKRAQQVLSMGIALAILVSLLAAWHQ